MRKTAKVLSLVLIVLLIGSVFSQQILAEEEGAPRGFVDWLIGVIGYFIDEHDQSSQAHCFYFDEDCNVGIGTTSPEYPLDVNGDVRGGGGVAFGNDGVIGLGGEQFDNFYKLFDFSHTITDFSSSEYWEPLSSHITLDPTIDLTGDNATTIYGHDIITFTAQSNDKDFWYVEGGYIGAWHRGAGTIDNLAGAGIAADNVDSGNVTFQVGAYIASGAEGTGSITDNFGLSVWSGHTGTGGTIANDYSVYIKSPWHDRPLTNHYGLY